MQGQSQLELLRTIRQLHDPRHNADGRYGDPPSTDTVTLVQDREGRVDRLPIGERFTHAHVHDVRDGSVVVLLRPATGGTVLAGNLTGAEVAIEAAPSCGTKGTPHGTTHLRRDTQRQPTLGRDQHRLHKLAVREAPQMLDRPVLAPLDRVCHGFIDTKYLDQRRTLRGRKIRHLVDRVRESLVNPFLYLTRAISRLTTGCEMLFERLVEHVGCERQQIWADVGAHGDSLNRPSGPCNLAAIRGAQVPAPAGLGPFHAT